MRKLLTFIAALACIGAAPPAAAEEPEVAFTKYHRAAKSGDLEEMLQFASAAQRAEIAAMSKAQKDAQAKMLVATLPRGFVLRYKNAAASGKSATLVLSGAAPALIEGKAETLYGTAKMVMEDGAWKVGETTWTNQPPAILSQPRPAAAKAEAKAEAKMVPPPKGSAPVVGSMEGPPVRKFGTAKPPCVFKPVMTAEDLENCR